MKRYVLKRTIGASVAMPAMREGHRKGAMITLLLVLCLATGAYQLFGVGCAPCVVIQVPGPCLLVSPLHSSRPVLHNTLSHHPFLRLANAPARARILLKIVHIKSSKRFGMFQRARIGLCGPTRQLTIIPSSSGRLLSAWSEPTDLQKRSASQNQGADACFERGTAFFLLLSAAMVAAGNSAAASLASAAPPPSRHSARMRVHDEYGAIFCEGAKAAY